MTYKSQFCEVTEFKINENYGGEIREIKKHNDTLAWRLMIGCPGGLVLDNLTLGLVGGGVTGSSPCL